MYKTFREELNHAYVFILCGFLLPKSCRIKNNHKQVFNTRPWFATNTHQIYMYSIQFANSAGDDFSKLPSRRHMFYMHVHPETFPPGGAFYFRRIYFVARSTYAYVHTCLEEECRIIKQSGSCTLRPLRLLYCCFPLNRQQIISSDITSSPLFATATKA